MIGSATTVRGTITGDEDLTVHGRVEGAIELSQDLTIAAGAVIDAQVTAQTIKVAGEVQGSLTAQKALFLEEGAVVSGEIRTPQLSIADGVRFSGRIEMDFEIEGLEPIEPEQTAPSPSTRRR